MIANGWIDGVFGVSWILLSLAATLTLIPAYFESRRPAPRFARHVTLPVIALAGLIARLIPALIFNRGATFDITSYHLVGGVVLAGQDVYTSPLVAGRYPYLPLHLWLSGLEVALSRGTGALLPFVVLVKIPPVLADAAIGPLIAAGLARRGVARQTALTAGMIYALNPVSILVTSFHGQFDAIPLLCALVAWYALGAARGGRLTRSTLVVAGLALGLAVLVKTWPLLILPAFVLLPRSWAQRILLAVMAAVPPAVATAVYLAAYHTPLRAFAGRVLGYSSLIDWWGIGLSVGILGPTHLITPAVASALGKVTELAILLVALAFLAWRRHRDIEYNIVTLILIFFVISAGFTVEYLIWIVPFLMLSPRTPAWLAASYLTLSACALLVMYMIGNMMYRFLHLSHGYALAVLFFVPVYLLAVWWLLKYQLPLARPVPAEAEAPRVAGCGLHAR